MAKKTYAEWINALLNRLTDAEANAFWELNGDKIYTVLKGWYDSCMTLKNAVANIRRKLAKKESEE